MKIPLVCAAGSLFVCAGQALAQASIGADVLLQGINDISTYGPVSGRYAYSLGSATCNVGNQNLEWVSQGSPGYAMNLYRIHNGRMVQIGLSNAKTACCAAAGGGCGLTCNGVGGNQLGSGCLDVYSSGWNAIQSSLAPRSRINAWTGAFQAIPGGSGDATFRRLQVAQSDMNTTTFPGAIYVAEGVYVSTRDAEAGNHNNNASHTRVNNSNNGATLTPIGGTIVGVPAIRAWRDHGLGVGVVDPGVNVGFVDAPGEGRYWFASKVVNPSPGVWRYEYAVFNLSSEIAGGKIEFPAPAGVNITNMGFSAPLYHSGEIYDNTQWTRTRAATEVVYASPQTFAQNPNSNALRWGTMYNFWFEADTAPDTTQRQARLHFFKPHSTPSITFNVPTPGPAPCDSIDVNADGQFPDTADIDFFLDLFAGIPCPNPCPADIDFNNDGLFPDTLDIDALISVFSGGPCLR